jgi:tetratricopeptide (TPR) repeat protein/transcriptional regulator with XRE-family HTH domain
MKRRDDDGRPEADLAFANLETVEDLGRALRLLRRRCRERSGSKLTYRDLADQTGYSHGAIGNWLSGKSLPSADRLDDLAAHLGASAGEQRALARAREKIEEHRAQEQRAAPPAPGHAGRPAAPPRQLPRGNPNFTGRTGDLQRLTSLLGRADTGTTIALVTGPAGIGKSSLAVHWAQQNLDQFPDGQLWVDLRGFGPSQDPMSPDDALRGFLAALGVPSSAIPADPQAQAALYRSLMAGQRRLLILDNARETSQVISLLPGDPGCAVLVTSRHQLTGLIARYGAQLLDLGLLAADEGRQLLSRYLGTGRLAAEPEAVADLLRYCAGLPLAISVVAARARTQPRLPLAALSLQLREAATRLDALDAGELAASVRAVLFWSLHALSTRAAMAFRLLGIAPGPDIGLAAAASLTKSPTAEIAAGLRELEAASLVQQERPGRYCLHDLVRLYAAERAGLDLTEDTRCAALRRVADYYLHTAYAADRLLAPHRPPVELAPPAAGCTPGQPADAPAALAWFDQEHSTLLAAHRLAIAHGWHAVTWQLAWALNTHHLRRGYRSERVAAWQAGLAAAEKLGEPATLILVHRWLGAAYAEAGQHALACDELHLAIECAEETGDVASQAHSHQLLAAAWGRQGDFARALEHAQRTFALVQSLSQPVREADALNVVGWSQAHLGQLDQARASCQPALELYRQHHDREGEAATLHNLAYIESRAGNHAQAIDHYRETARLCRDLGNTYREAETLTDLAPAYLARGQYAEARATWQQALNLYLLQGRAADVTRVREQLNALPPPTA